MVKISRKSSNEAQLDRLMIDTEKSLYRMQKCESSSTTRADYTFQATLIIPLHAKSQLRAELCKIMQGYDKIISQEKNLMAVRILKIKYSYRNKCIITSCIFDATNSKVMYICKFRLQCLEIFHSNAA